MVNTPLIWPYSTKVVLYVTRRGWLKIALSKFVSPGFVFVNLNLDFELSCFFEALQLLLDF